MESGPAKVALAMCLGLLGSACASDDDEPSIVVPEKLALVADWLQRSVSYVDVDKLAAGGASREAIVSTTLDLSAHAPGPLAIELTPDKKTALVSISAGFFSIPLSGALVNASDIPQDPGKLLFLDVASGKVAAELITGESPMGIAITPDGKRAFVAHFGSNDLAVVDVEKRALVERIAIGTFPEEIAFDDSATVGIVGYSTAGSVMAFTVADPKNSLTPVTLPGDSAGVTFFPGTKLAFVVQAPNPLSTMSGFSLIDVSNPAAPVVLQDERLSETPIGYPAIAAKNRSSVLVPVTTEGRMVLREYKLEGVRASLVNSIDIAEASLLAGLGLAYDEDHTVLIAWPSKRALVTVDLPTKTSRVIAWPADRAGPADVVFR